MQRLDLKVRLMLGDEIAMGPGKADLLEAIEREGSISAAARALGMSYRRAWLLVETMNRCFSQPLVQALAGGRQGGGAQLSDEGRQVLQRYRQLQARLRAVAEQDWPELAALLR
ncbi:winged helix-turn-helix domain-containing protein [Pseudomonas fluvialis]|jgi:molybdate transport system regulatory protein|uniref:LysR family transcriptional regulator n=1 Tax=Pseudomonas fluvialis TaxID=1793966 RepID=A0A2I0CLQ6_9PSED|nr:MULTISPECIES: LysR family transcriptional regulator [Pseudomonas]MBP8262727.1 LysR family transcriptional regulator [Pseudomonas sp.]OXM40452.1 LysR family transcriptional regulator [Pseudomonas fluvialis]PKF70089.1 LysR family transcriptional regulator [Pseudomonas pharmacofabricae]GGH89505.1 LysR family transcriptional regulator [Pseudomonas fluvialis]